jgi:hypothetical protein
MEEAKCVVVARRVGQGGALRYVRVSRSGRFLSPGFSTEPPSANSDKRAAYGTFHSGLQPRLLQGWARNLPMP